MLHRLQRHAAWFTGWLLISLLGTLVAAQLELTRMREGFEADTRTALRLLNQRVSQHDAMLSTLTYLRPGSEPGRPEQRLPSIMPTSWQCNVAPGKKPGRTRCCLPPNWSRAGCAAQC